MSRRRTRSARTATYTLPALGRLHGPGSRDIATGLWGNQWISRIEDPGTSYGYGYGSSGGQDSRMARARTYARKGAVGEITVRPGLISARVQGSRRTPYRCEIHVPELADAEWDRLFEGWSGAAEQVLPELAHGRLGPQAYDFARRAQVELVPQPGQFTYHCSCPDWGDPCKHAAALAYVFARRLEQHADALLVLRGRELVDVCTEVAVRYHEAEQAALEEEAAERSAAEEQARGVPAGEAFARAREAGGLPALPPLPASAAGHREPADLTARLTAGESVDPTVLRLLAADAARRAADAYACAVGVASPEPGAPAAPDGGDLVARLWLDADPWHDTVRRAAGDTDPYLVGRLMNSSDQARAQLARASVAWRHGGPSALAALDGEHVPGPENEAAAREQLAGIRIPGRVAPPRLQRTRGRLRLVGEDLELRWGPDGRWYPYTKNRGQWWAAGPPAADAAQALRGVLAAK